MRFRALAAFAALGFTSAAHAIGSAPTDWLHFPMYERDTAHAVDLSAIKVRPDGLIESATRYPRSGGESWTPEESARGWYYYAPRLIDCETGFSIDAAEMLLAHDGAVVARHDNAAERLAEWKKSIPSDFTSQKWPDNSELFLACAAAFDPRVRTDRAKLAKRAPAFLSDKPLFESLLADTHRLHDKMKPGFDEAKLRQHPPATIKGVMLTLLQQRRDWIAGFAPSTAWTLEPSAPQPAWSDASKEWLRTQDLEIEDLRSHGDGLLDVVLTTRSTDLLGAAYEHRPRKAADANNALLTMLVDCRTGLTAEDKIVWRDFENRPLATQVISTKDAEGTFDTLLSAQRDEEPNLMESAPRDRAVRQICAAAAMQCKGSAVAPRDDARAEDDQERELTAEDLAAIDRAATPAEALLVVRARVRAWRNRLIPSCRIGG
jgi:hypothetical protein